MESCSENNISKNTPRKNKIKTITPFKIIAICVTIIWLLALFFPVYWLVLSSTKDPLEAMKNPPSFSVVLPKDYVIYLDSSDCVEYNEEDFKYESLIVSWMLSNRNLNINLNSVSVAWCKDDKIIATSRLSYDSFKHQKSNIFAGNVAQKYIDRFREGNTEEYKQMLSIMDDDGYKNNLSKNIPSGFNDNKYTQKVNEYFITVTDPTESTLTENERIVLQATYIGTTSSNNFKGLFRNYIDAWQYDTESKYNFGTFMLNTLIVAVVAVLLQFVFSSATAYGLQLIKQSIAKIIGLFFLITIMIPGIIQQVPLYCFFYNNNLANTYWSIWLPGCVSPVNIILFQAFFGNLPKEIREAAKIDGASEFFIFIKLIIPLSLPVFAAIGIMTFIGNWNDFFWPNLMITSEEKFTFTLAIQNTLSSNVSAGVRNYSLSLAMSVIATIPTLFMFAFMQKQMREGLVFGSLKG